MTIFAFNVEKIMLKIKIESYSEGGIHIQKCAIIVSECVYFTRKNIDILKLKIPNFC